MSLEERSSLNKEAGKISNARLGKFIISLFIMLPYFLIGFLEAFNSKPYLAEKIIQFNENFKFNMFVMGLVGLAFNFYPEVRLILSHFVPSAKSNLNDSNNENN
jgi:uncharacterized membrane protein YadS